MAEVAFVGVGQMGTPMVARLVGAGYSVTAFVRRPEKADELSAIGATPVSSTTELADSADIVINCLFSDEQLLAVCGGPDGLLARCAPGTVFVSHTTGAVETLDVLRECGDRVAVLDAPVSGTAQDIADGRVTLLVGGNDDAVARIRPVVESYAHPVIRTGGPGSAMRMKLVNNALFAANAQLVCAATEIAASLGIDHEAFLAALQYCSGGSTAARHVRHVGGTLPFEERAAPFLRKDVEAFTNAIGHNLGLIGRVVAEGPLALSKK